MEPMNKLNPYAVISPPAAAGTEKTSGLPSEENNPKSGCANPSFDEYIPEEKHASIGLYRTGTDETGKPKIYFDDPEHNSASNAAPEEASSSSAPEKKAENKKAERCIGSTDKVDREIEKLKKQKQELEAQLRTEKDETKAEALEKKLAQVENELRRKDNDAYRRQHSTFS